MSDAEIFEKTIKACKNNDFNQFKHLLNIFKSDYFQFKDQNDYNIIHWITSTGNLEMLLYLSKFDPNFRYRLKDITKKGIFNGLQTPLHLAAKNNYYKIIMFLLEKQIFWIDLNHEDQRGDSVLNILMQNGNEALAFYGMALFSLNLGFAELDHGQNIKSGQYFQEAIFYAEQSNKFISTWIPEIGQKRIQIKAQAYFNNQKSYLQDQIQLYKEAHLFYKKSKLLLEKNNLSEAKSNLEKAQTKCNLAYQINDRFNKAKLLKDILSDLDQKIHFEEAVELYEKGEKLFTQLQISLDQNKGQSALIQNLFFIDDSESLEKCFSDCLLKLKQIQGLKSPQKEKIQNDSGQKIEFVQVLKKQILMENLKQQKYLEAENSYKNSCVYFRCDKEKAFSLINSAEKQYKQFFNYDKQQNQINSAAKENIYFKLYYAKFQIQQDLQHKINENYKHTQEMRSYYDHQKSVHKQQIENNQLFIQLEKMIYLNWEYKEKLLLSTEQKQQFIQLQTQIGLHYACAVLSQHVYPLIIEGKEKQREIPYFNIFDTRIIFSSKLYEITSIYYNHIPYIHFLEELDKIEQIQSNNNNNQKQTNYKTGYLGSAYKIKINDKIIIIIAHCGTVHEENGDLAADSLLVFDQLHPQFESAQDFTNKIKNKYQYLFTNPNTAAKLYHTGHSLGAVLAEFTAAQNQENAITFDSPGSYDLLFKQKKNVQNQIITYLAAPNFINTIKPHVGSCYYLDFKFKSDENKEIEQIAENFFTKFLKQQFFEKLNNLLDKVDQIKKPLLKLIKRDVYIHKIDNFIEELGNIYRDLLVKNFSLITQQQNKNEIIYNSKFYENPQGFNIKQIKKWPIGLSQYFQLASCMLENDSFDLNNLSEQQRINNFFKNNKSIFFEIENYNKANQTILPKL